LSLSDVVLQQAKQKKSSKDDKNHYKSLAAAAASYRLMSAIYLYSRDRSSWEDILVTPAQCAWKYITYTTVWPYAFAMQAAAGYLATASAKTCRHILCVEKTTLM